MSLDLNVYCKEISENLIPEISERLNKFDMTVEINPNFKFNQCQDSGFLPFKFSLKNSIFPGLSGKELISGFEIYIEDFDFEKERDASKEKLGFFERLFQKTQSENYFANSEIDETLKTCKKLVIFNWGSHDSFELRFALLTSAILTKITNGVCHYPADDIWFENENLVESTFKEVIEYEKSIEESEIIFHEFDSW